MHGQIKSTCGVGETQCHGAIPIQSVACRQKLDNDDVHNMATFSELSLAKQRLVRTTSNSANQMSSWLTPAAMADKHAEKVDKCPPNWGRQVLFAYNSDHEKCLLYGVVGCLLFRGCFIGRTVGTFGGIVCYLVGVHS